MRRLTFKQSFDFPRTYWGWCDCTHHDPRVMKAAVAQGGAKGNADDREVNCIADAEFEINLAASR